MPAPPRTRPPLVYRLALLAPVVTFIALAATGNWPTPELPQGSDRDFYSAFAISVLWLVSLGPLLYLAWELGRQHTSARRLQHEIPVGLYHLGRIALTGSSEGVSTDTFARPPNDNPGLAAAWGIGLGLLVPTFFAVAAPFLRTPKALIWLAVTGVIFGTVLYNQRRAAAYLEDEPPMGMFRQWQLLNPSRYRPEGRRFVDRIITLTILLPFWWLGGGFLALNQ